LTAWEVQGDCRITQYMVEQSNRIFAYREASGSLQLQRRETVPSGVTLCMYCNPTDVVETLCQDNGQFSVPLPMSCYNPMKPMATRIRDTHKILEWFLVITLWSIYGAFMAYLCIKLLFLSRSATRIFHICLAVIYLYSVIYL